MENNLPLCTMLLLTYSFNTQQNFSEIQNFFNDRFGNNYIKNCQEFNSCGRKQTEISFLFLEKELHIFYSIPKCDEYDIIYIERPCNIKDFMLELYNVFDGDIDIIVHIPNMNHNNTKKFINKFFPKETQEDLKDIENIIKKDDFYPSCSFYTSPYMSNDIQFVFNTYDELQSSILNTIDGSNENNFLPSFFNLVSLLFV